MNHPTLTRRGFITAGATGAAAVVALGLGACTTTGSSAPDDKADRRREIDSGVDGALTKLYGQSAGAKALGDRSNGILVFPRVLAGGFIVGGEYGDGALRVAGQRQSQGYYRTISGSFGLLAGGQSKAVILMFMTPSALDKFVKSSGWKAGVDASVAVAKIGANGELDTETGKQEVVGFVLTNAGLMANVSLEGAKISKLDL